MGQGDLMPIGGHKRKRDPKRVKKIIEGGKKADAIRKKTDEHHEKVEVPIAEDKLLDDLKQIPNNQ